MSFVCVCASLFFLMVAIGHCEDNLTTIQPVNQFYWLGSTIQLICKTRNARKVDYCKWSINAKKLIESSDRPNCANERLIYRLFGNLSEGECGIIVMAASAKESGEWKCQMVPLEGDPSEGHYTASTKVTVLKLTLREFSIIFCGLLVMVTSWIMFACAIKYNRSKLTHPSITSARRMTRVELLDRLPSAPEADFLMPPPTYSMVVSSRLTPNEYSMTELTGYVSQHDHQGYQVSC